MNDCCCLPLMFYLPQSKTGKQISSLFLIWHLDFTILQCTRNHLNRTHHLKQTGHTTKENSVPNQRKHVVFPICKCHVVSHHQPHISHAPPPTWTIIDHYWQKLWIISHRQPQLQTIFIAAVNHTYHPNYQPKRHSESPAIIVSHYQLPTIVRTWCEQ